MFSLSLSLARTALSVSLSLSKPVFVLRCLVAGAFVFVKPHAVTEPVKALLKSTLGAAGIRVVGEGCIPGETIDKEMLIDNHYGAIAAKAVKTKPADLCPSDKAKAAFSSKFGLTWEEAVKKGLVYNAMDGCAKLGVNGDQLDTIWGTLKKDVTLIKFGGGFYCGQVNGIYIINGFCQGDRCVYSLSRFHHSLSSLSKRAQAGAPSVLLQRNGRAGPVRAREIPSLMKREIVCSGRLSSGRAPL